MVSSAASTVQAYLGELPPERRDVVSAIRAMVNAHMPAGYEEAMNWGMITWQVPLTRYPITYNKQPLAYVALAAQKNNYSLYLMGVSEDSVQGRTLRAAAAAQGIKLDMGKCCVRFKRTDELPLAAIGASIASLSVDAYIALHEAARGSAKAEKSANSAKTTVAKPAKVAAAKPAKPAKASESAKASVDDGAKTGKSAAAGTVRAPAGRAKRR